jgi:hypothetical protein
LAFNVGHIRDQARIGHQTSFNHRRIHMAKKSSRVRVLMMPYQDDSDKCPVGYSAIGDLPGVSRAIQTAP